MNSNLRRLTLIGAATLAGFQMLPATAHAAAAAPRTSDGKRCTIVGTPRNDRLVGRPGNDVICGLGGNDVIAGGAGNDVVDGGAGDDTISGGDGNDTLIGGAGDDTMSGSNGDDRERGESGDDRLSGGDGDDDLDGGRGADRIFSGRGKDTCVIRSDDVSAADACTDKLQPVLEIGTAAWREQGDDGRVTLTVRASDDRSGVASVGAVLQGSDGTVALAGSRHGSRNDAEWRLRGDVAAGEWRLSALTVTDRAGHVTHYLFEGGTYTTDLAGATGGTIELGPIAVAPDDSSQDEDENHDENEHEHQDELAVTRN